MADYTGSFSGSFQGTISGSLLGSGIVSGSTQIDFNSIVNKPTTIQPFQANSITSNNNFRQVTFPAFSSSVSTDLISLESSVSTLSGQVQAAVSGTVPPGTISSSTQIAAFGYILSSQTSSFVLSSQTSSYALKTDISGAFTSVSGGLAGRITTLEGTAGGSTDITALNLFTGSIQIQVNNLTSATSSYLTSANTGSFILVSQTSSMSVLSALTASFISDVFISASVLRSGFGSSGGTIQVSGSTTAGVQINKVFSSLQFDSLTGLNVSESISGTAFVSIGSHFRDIIVNGSATLVATGSDSLEIIAGNGIQIFTSLFDTNADGISKELEFRLDTSSQHFTNAVTNIALVSGIFTLTGSFYSTTNNIQITGSLSVGSGSFKSFEVNSDGFVVLGDMDKDLNNAPEGTIAYSGSSFYLIT